MRVEIITPEEILLDAQEVVSVVLPGSDGKFEILKNHAPIVASLKAGVVKVTLENKTTQEFEVNSGLIEFANNHLNVLVS
ncbi:MAG: hypothetical protein MUE53_01595 [Chitinophagales bacterium]|jgi:F-type H+-transporting ATPase subunit epsilon|nr:hypothetical protein [Chitinophagales bacterium]